MSPVSFALGALAGYILEVIEEIMENFFFPHLKNLFCHGASNFLIKTHCFLSQKLLIEIGMFWEASYRKPLLAKTLLGIKGRQE